MTGEFLAISKARGNDPTTPAPEHGVGGLRPGDHWCLCIERWKEVLDAGLAPSILLRPTHEAALELVDLEALMEHALDIS